MFISTVADKNQGMGDFTLSKWTKRRPIAARRKRSQTAVVQSRVSIHWLYHSSEPECGTTTVSVDRIRGVFFQIVGGHVGNRFFFTTVTSGAMTTAVKYR